ncbi:MAG: hypothetical protein IPO21_11875 [Bacteroidales bacterium]|nr:hypothetical protein [Bacteroidales bacterium]
MKKFSCIKCFSIIATILLMGSCAKIYLPTSNFAPLLEEKGEVKAELSASSTGLHLSGAVAATKKLAIVTSGTISYGNFTNRYDLLTVNVEDGDDDNDFAGNFSTKYGELGLGVYNIPLGIFRMEAFGGAGLGKADDRKEYYRYTRDYDAQYYLGYIQMNVGGSIKKFFEYGISLRFATSFYDYSYDTPKLNFSVEDLENSGYDIESFQDQTDFSLFHFEPSMFYKIGFNRLKFVYRMGLTTCAEMKAPKQTFDEIDVYDGNVDAKNVFMALGLNVKIGGKK